ncbi:hypothetical protein VTJ83DRAFT_1305 [Remersonia thermophila]|uniref:Uncharacterized protein n=1 Tax=Remersonia thermophila TaxID=72144 RepID=A0ABR4DRN4_9PEZI
MAAPKAESEIPGAGDVFRTLNLPDKFMVGLDTMALTTSKSLAGFRDIPPGPHFLWVQQPEGVSRCGYWFVTSKTHRAVRVKEWDGYNETLGDVSSASRDSSLESVYSGLKPYALHNRSSSTGVHWSLGDPLPEWARAPERLWSALTSAISLEALARFTGKKGVNEVFVDSTDVRRDEDGPVNAPQVDNAGSGLSFFFLQDFRDLQVLELGGNRSRGRSEDTSARVEVLLSNNSNCSSSSSSTSNPHDNNQITEREILAELQLTFLTGTHLGNAACLEQWWNLLLKILLRAYRVAATRPQFAAGVIRTLHAQLLYTEHYFGTSSSSGPSGLNDKTTEEIRGTRNGPSSDRPIFQYKPHNRKKLYRALIEYKRRVGGLVSALGNGATAEHRAVMEAFEELEVWLWRWNWDLRAEAAAEKVATTAVNRGSGDEMMWNSEDEEDEQPVVVELDENGREVGLVSFRD